MKILLLSDATMCANAGGLAQTLYNIFSFVDPRNILCITSDNAFEAFEPSARFRDSYVTYSFDVISIPRNRIGKHIKPFVEWFNYSYNNLFRRFNKTRNQIRSFNPDIVISCSNGAQGIFMHKKLLKGLNIKKVYPYFMDDWMYKTKLKWVGGEINDWVKKILTDNSAWLMISNDLAEILEERYNIKPERVLEIHNPVDLANAPGFVPVIKKEAYTLAYAGSLWPMHFDAFYVIAKAVKQLNSSREINLIVYTSGDFWNWRKKELESLNVTYGGSIPYNEIHQKLNEADALVLSSSFSNEWYTHSKGSVQTKVTDYLKAGRLIISCGPAYSANHNFIKKYKCGICIETNNVDAAADLLNKALDNIEESQSSVLNGRELLEKEFSFSRVQNKLLHFIS